MRLSKDIQYSSLRLVLFDYLYFILLLLFLCIFQSAHSQNIDSSKTALTNPANTPQSLSNTNTPVSTTPAGVNNNGVNGNTANGTKNNQQTVTPTPPANTIKSDSARFAKKKNGILYSIKKIFHNPFSKPKRDSNSSSAKINTRKADSATAAKYATSIIHIPKAPGNPVSSLPKNPVKTDTAKKASTSKNDSIAKADSINQSQKKSWLYKAEHSASTHGSISVGYDYGVLPFASDMQVPMGYFHSEGQGDFSIAKLPFIGSYYYSDLKDIAGLNNYFRIAFDAQKFAQQYLGKVAQQEEAIRTKLMQAYKSRQAAQQKLLYLESSLSMPQIKSPNGSLPQTGALGKDGYAIASAVGDTIKKDQSGLKADTINGPKTGGSLKSDSAALAKSAKSTLAKDTASFLKNDSTKTQIEKYKKDISEYDKLIEKYNHEMGVLKNTANAMERNNPYMNKLYNFMGGVKKFEIGLCYPNYSTFLMNGMAVKGVNIEYEKEDIYTAITEGTTVNTLLFTNNTVQNKLINVQNYYNMFDFNSVQNGRKIIAAKAGVGQKEGTHFFVGMLYGSGLPSYATYGTTSTITTLPSGISKNYVLELDGQYAIDKNNILSLVYGKSSTETSVPGYTETDGGLLNSTQSKALQGKYKLIIPKTKSTITLTARWIDPYFNSFGLGYVRSDNLRYELKLDQQLTKKVKISLFVRRDEDDVIQLYDYRTMLVTIGGNATIKLMRSLTLRLGYTPVLEHMYDFTNPLNDIFNYNNICNGVLTYAPIIHGLNTVFNLSYSYYKLTTDTQTMEYQNISFSNITRFKNSLSNSITFSWFKASPADSTNNDIWMLSDEVGYTFAKKMTVAIGGTAAYNPLQHNWQYGYLLKVKIPVVKHLSCDIEGQKLVMGDFYDSFNIEQIERFPYLLQGKITYTW